MLPPMSDFTIVIAAPNLSGKEIPKRMKSHERGNTTFV